MTGRYAAGYVAVPAEVLGRGVDDQVSSVLKRAADDRRRERGVDHEQRASLVREPGQLGQVGDRHGRVGERLGQDDRRRWPNRGFDMPEVGHVDEVGLDAEAGRDIPQEAVGAAVYRGWGDDVSASPGERPQYGRDRRHAGRERLRGNLVPEVDPFKGGDRGAEGFHRGVVDSAVAVAGRGVAQHRRVLRARTERECGRAVDRSGQRWLVGHRRRREMHGPGVLAGASSGLGGRRPNVGRDLAWRSGFAQSEGAAGPLGQQVVGEAGWCTGSGRSVSAVSQASFRTQTRPGV